MSILTLDFYFRRNFQPNLFFLKPLFDSVSFPRRDESASATYYFGKKTESERANENVSKTCASAGDSLVKEWMYYRPLQHGESEFPLRNKQVRSVRMLCFSS